MVSKKVIIIVIAIVVILLLAGLGVGLYFLLRKDNTTNPTGGTGTTNNRGQTGTTNNRPPTTGATGAANPGASTPPATQPIPPGSTPNPTSITNILYSQVIPTGTPLTVVSNIPVYYTYASMSQNSGYQVPASSLMISSTTVFNGANGYLVTPLASEIPNAQYVVNYYYRRNNYLSIEFPRTWRNEGILPNNLIEYAGNKLFCKETFVYCLSGDVIKSGEILASNVFPLTTVGSGDIYFYQKCYLNNTILNIPSSDVAQIIFYTRAGGYMTPACESNVNGTSSLFFFRYNLNSKKIEILIPSDWLGVTVDNGLIQQSGFGPVNSGDLYVYTFRNNLNYRKVALASNLSGTIQEFGSYKVYRKCHVFTVTNFDYTSLYDLAFNYTQDNVSYRLMSNNLSVHGNSKFALFYYWLATNTKTLYIYFPTCNRYSNANDQNLLIKTSGNTGTFNGNMEAWYFS